MLKRIKALLDDFGGGDGDAVRPHEADELQLAAAALLVEAALMDNRLEDLEKTKITELIKSRFGLDDEEAAGLFEAAVEQVEESHQLFGFTRIINARFSHEERLELMEMLWQVVYADGRVHDYESSLMRRIAGLIHVSDRDSGIARKRALAHQRTAP